MLDFINTKFDFDKFKSSAKKLVNADEINFEVYLEDEDILREVIIDDKKHKIDRGTYKKRIDELVAEIDEFSSGRYNIKVYVYDEINAFAYPDGSIRVYSKLMDILEDDELIAIIGHEMGHVHNMDSFHAYILAKKMAAAKSIVESLPFESGSFPQKFNEFIDAQYSQRQEYKADEYGMNIAMLYGYDPYAAARALDKLVEIEQGESHSFIEKMMATHPASKNRAERIRRIIKEYGSLVDYLNENHDYEEDYSDYEEFESETDDSEECERFNAFLQSFLDDEYKDWNVHKLARMFEKEGTECDDPITMSMYYCTAAVVRLDAFFNEWVDNNFRNYPGRGTQSEFQHECLINGLKDIRAAKNILPNNKEYQYINVAISILKDFWVDERLSRDYYQFTYSPYLDNAPEHENTIFNPKWIYGIIAHSYERIMRILQ